MRPRGFGVVEVIIALGVAAALIAAIWGGLAWWASVNFKRGEAAARLADLAAGQARDSDVSDAVKEREAALELGRARAASNEAKWKEALRDADRTNADLASCEVDQAGPAEPDRAVLANGDPGVGTLRAPTAPRDHAGDHLGVRLLWRFVGLHDGAFTGLDGESLFDDSARFALDAARADTASPYGLRDVASVGGSNAIALSACRREYFALRGKVVRAELVWDKATRR